MSSLPADFPAEAEPRDAAVPIPAFPAAAAGSVQPGAGAPGPAAAGDGDGAPASGATDAGSSLLRRTRHAGGAPARPQGNRTEAKSPTWLTDGGGWLTRVRSLILFLSVLSGFYAICDVFGTELHLICQWMCL